MNHTQAQRLLNVATALRESVTPEDFTMLRYGNPCGTPACALGHYASRRDLQKTFRLEIKRRSDVVLDEDGHALWYDHSSIQDHFGIDQAEAEYLFSGGGCGGAETTDQAATYIERFLEDRGWVVT